MKRRALISVSNKNGVAEFARELYEMGFEIISTGGTARTLAEAQIPVVPVSKVTGAPEMLGGRVKTLHPKIHGGILADLEDPAQVVELVDHDIGPIDLVCVNLYPFEETVADGASEKETLEQIDIGGPRCSGRQRRTSARSWLSPHPPSTKRLPRNLSSARSPSKRGGASPSKPFAGPPGMTKPSPGGSPSGPRGRAQRAAPPKKLPQATNAFRRS